MSVGVVVSDVDPGRGQLLYRTAGGEDQGGHAGHVVEEAEHRGDQLVVTGHQDRLQDVVRKWLDHTANDGLQNVANCDENDYHRNFHYTCNFEAVNIFSAILCYKVDLLPRISEVNLDQKMARVGMILSTKSPSSANCIWKY